MTTNAYQIGATYGELASLSALATPVTDPEGVTHFVAYSRALELGDGTVRGGGFPSTKWHWGFMSAAQYAQLKTFCAGKSANVVIRTTDGTYTTGTPDYAAYNAVMVWPEGPEEVDKFAGRILNVTIEFRHLVIISEGA